MKKNLFIPLTALVAICFGNQAKAQVTATSQPVTVNINLTDAISITLGATPTVNFTYTTAADYTASKTIEKAGHFTVVSNKPYNLTVAATAAFTPAGGPALDIVTVNVPSASANGGTPEANVPLSTTPAALVNGSTATTGASYTVDYTIADPASLLNLGASAYSTTVTYTATQL
ncbi:MULTISPECIES: hypothetical protein [unclassified Sphingobacterium]|uniref:hypothetical protein n=1 Tax=unclassified Sphingobacterium TaxID=2609468 RepID=UPI001AE4304B|nr:MULTISPECIES: hypothetical protein [unclassified Sphingobacterium]MDR6733690.1 hypothetical protein [Sphingobacterium sp. 2149]